MDKRLDEKSRRQALLISAIGVGSVGVGLPSSTAHAQTPKEPEFSRSPPPTRVDPSPIVVGQYELAYQENYAQALITLGFSYTAVMWALIEDKSRLSFSFVGRDLSVSSVLVTNRDFIIGRQGTLEILGHSLLDWATYFDKPDRLIASFTAPNGQQAFSVSRFTDAGMKNLITIASETKLMATRVWRRRPEERGKPGIRLL